MIVGRYYGRVESKNKIMRFISTIFGILDLHTQMRTEPLMKYIVKMNSDFLEKNIVEIGCGGGSNCFEVFFNSKPKNIVGFDLNNKSIAAATQVAYELGVSDKVKFYSEDITLYDFSSIGNIDCLLLIDFLEHINDPGLFLEHVARNLNIDSTIIISVPTYNYKKVFGEQFHINVGHVKDGYNIIEIEELFKAIGYKVESHSYNTGLVGLIGCFINYRIIFGNKYLNVLKQLLLYPFSALDFINNKYVSSSLFVVLKNDKNV